MVEYDPSGYMAGRPIRPEAWKSRIPDMPAGVMVARDAFPPGFLFVQNFLTPEVCDRLVAECEALPGIKQGVAAGGDDLSTVHSDVRISETVDIHKLKTDVFDLVRRAYAETVAPNYGVEIEWFERPEILRYRVGGEYKPHSDAENWFADERKWKRVIDRDISILIYLNEGFVGGEIAFPNFGMQLQPKRGLLIAFPSDARYLHTARPLISGVRYALVSWSAVKGSPRVGPEAAPGDRILMNS